jgi:hypothetical protein
MVFLPVTPAEKLGRTTCAIGPVCDIGKLGRNR